MNPNPLSQMPASLIVARPAETPAVPSPVAQTVWDYKHAAVTLALVLTVFGPLIVQYWPASAPAIAQVQKAAQIIADQPAAKPTATVPKESPKPPCVKPTALRTARPAPSQNCDTSTSSPASMQKRPRLRQT